MTNLAAAALRLLTALDPHEAFNAERLFRLLYLADWKATLEGHSTLTGITWTAEGRADLVGQVPEEDSRLVEFLQEATGEVDVHRIIERIREEVKRSGHALTAQDEATLNFVTAKAARKSWEELNLLVFSTRPVLAGPRHQPLDLPRAAREQEAAGARRKPLQAV